MITTQQQLDSCLNRIHTVPVSVSPYGPLPPRNAAYASLEPLLQNGFSFSPRQLLHAIGCKTAVFPMSAEDECLKAAWLYTNILDLEGPYLCFQGAYGGDLQIARSQEIGIGIMCLIAERCFGIPWDQLGPLPGQGKRFDYRGEVDQLQCIFESKGTSYRGNQNNQIASGLDKKQAHHSRGEHFDVELIISSCIEHNGGMPKILLADPDKSSFKKLYDRGDDRYYRLKHYCRVLQFVGLPKSAFNLNRYALDYLYARRSIYRTIIEEKKDIGYLESINIGGDQFLGRWFDSWLPKESKRYKHQYERGKEFFITPEGKCRSIFQGVRLDVYKSGLIAEPFSQVPVIKKEDLKRYQMFNWMAVSVFSDGTVMMFRQNETDN